MPGTNTNVPRLTGHVRGQDLKLHQQPRSCPSATMQSNIATMESYIAAISDSLLTALVFESIGQSAPPSRELGPSEVRRVGRYFGSIKATCSRFYKLWTRAFITEHGAGKWLFVQYDDKVAIFEVETMQLPLSNGDSEIERMRIYLQKVCSDCIANWKHFQNGVRLKIDKTNKNIRDIVKSSVHLEKIDINGECEESLLVNAKRTSGVAVVDFVRGRNGLKKKWMEKQIEIIGERRAVLEVMRPWTMIAKYWTVPPTKTRGEVMATNLDKTGIRTKLMELEMMKGGGESIVTTLLANTSYTTLFEVWNATVPKEMTYLTPTHLLETVLGNTTTYTTLV